VIYYIIRAYLTIWFKGDMDVISETIVYTCRRCGSENIVKNGANACGNQQYWCKDCNARLVLKPTVRYPQERKDEIMNAYKERPSMRGISRMFGVSRETLADWLKKNSTTSQT